MSQQPARINELTSAELAVVHELDSIRARLQWTDRRFFKRFLSRPTSDGVQYSYSTWIRFRQNKWTGDTRSVARHFAECLDEARRYLNADLAARPMQGADEYFVTPDAQAVLDAIAIARLNRNVKRLVMYIAPPGGGKSALVEHLKLTYGGYIAYADEAWRRSNAAGWIALAKTLGVNEQFRSTVYMQEAVLQRARELGRSLLIIEDANTFGPHTCNMIRDLCNHTMLTIVLVGTAIPFNVEGRGGYKEGEQMRRRAVLIKLADKITPECVAPFFSWSSLNGSAAPALQAVADAANMYNKYDFVVSVSTNLREEFERKPITLSDVRRRIDIEAKKLLRASK